MWMDTISLPSNVMRAPCWIIFQDQHDTIDLTDNSLTTLSNLPLSPRLRSLILANNSIHAIHPSIQQSAPNLTTLILTNNAFAELGDLEARVAKPAYDHIISGLTTSSRCDYTTSGAG